MELWNQAISDNVLGAIYFAGLATLVTAGTTAWLKRDVLLRWGAGLWRLVNEPCELTVWTCLLILAGSFVSGFFAGRDGTENLFYFMVSGTITVLAIFHQAFRLIRNDLSSPEIALLIAIGDLEFKNVDATEDQIERRGRFHRIEMKHYLDSLKAGEYIGQGRIVEERIPNSGIFSTHPQIGLTVSYALTAKGRAYLVNQHFLPH
jgi:hypothetical protein